MSGMGLTGYMIGTQKLYQEMNAAELYDFMNVELLTMK